MNLIDLLRPAPYIEAIKDEEEIKRKYKYWRWRLFYSMYIGYAFYYFTRKSFTFAMPKLIEELGYTKADLGLLASVLAISYGLSKFICGIFGDRSNPRYFMGIGLILTAICNIFFGLSSTIPFFALFWGLNGLAQGMGWPPCARILTHWYAQSERGMRWGVWSTAHSVGGALIPLVATAAGAAFGWRFAMFIPAALCICIGFFLINRMRDTPQSLGLPRIETFKNEVPKGETKDTEERELTVKEILFKYVLSNKYVWILSISYFFVYVIRQAVNDWTVLYLVEQKGYSTILAGTGVFWFEVGGFCGILSAGWASDKIFRGRRVPMMVLFSAAVVVAIAFLAMIPPGYIVLDSLALFLIGYFIFGPQMLTGIAVAELAHKKAAATASGFAGNFAYLGAASAGYPLGRATEVWGWNGYYIILAISGFICLILMLPLWGVKPKPRPINA